MTKSNPTVPHSPDLETLEALRALRRAVLALLHEMLDSPHCFKFPNTNGEQLPHQWHLSEILDLLLDEKDKPLFSVRDVALNSHSSTIVPYTPDLETHKTARAVGRAVLRLLRAMADCPDHFMLSNGKGEQLPHQWHLGRILGLLLDDCSEPRFPIESVALYVGPAEEV